MILVRLLLADWNHIVQEIKEFAEIAKAYEECATYWES